MPQNQGQQKESLQAKMSEYFKFDDRSLKIRQ